MSVGWTNYSVVTSSHAGDEDSSLSVGGEDVPACASCKKRKLRCSRETPTCSHCLRLSSECIYQPKQKPGLKPGAVEALARRVVLLERILLDESGSVRPQFSVDDEKDHDRLPDDGEQIAEKPDAERDTQSKYSRQNQQNPSAPRQEATHQLPEKIVTKKPPKRRLESQFLEGWCYTTETTDLGQYLPSQTLLEKIADFFCISFHHWIPYIHKQRLQTQVRNGIRDQGLDLMLHALVAVSLRHMDPHVIFLDPDEVYRQCEISRMIVETHAMRTVSVQSLQALILLVFDHLNNGETQKAWPIIGSLTRTIDYLQLTTEPSSSQSGSLMTPLRLVQPTSDWTELEERRRLFWVIFLLDRFCSYTTGWNTSLTADDVHRRLPADGGYFTREEPVTTPYFGIWNKAAARIGRSLANVPAQYNEEDPAVEHFQGQTASPNSANGYIDASKLGAFAYCVEATESLSQVTTFFLQQRINWQDKEHAISWLTRFKELDLRLVHWKIFLPTRWKDSNISSDRSIVDMDPNLTLAHITHNTSMILLHHPIAYPPQALWSDYVALPKECSAQTCVLAAVETSNIVDKFLAHTLIPFVNVQFSFCAFVAGKTLLFEHQETRLPLRPEFQRLVRDLWDMSRRWDGKSAEGDHTQSSTSLNQAGLYARHLEGLLENFQQDVNFRFDFYGHCEISRSSRPTISPTVSTKSRRRTGSLLHDISHLTPHVCQTSSSESQPEISPRNVPSTAVNRSSTITSPAYEQRQVQMPNTHLASGAMPSTYMAPPTLLGYPGQGQSLYQAGPITAPASLPITPGFQDISGLGTNQSVQDRSLLSLSDAFMDSHFLDMDRVITFEDANFLLPGDTFRWQ